ncbi:MAG: putative 2-dehydropantoate 2-reductase [Lentisphaerae bacterium]|jgi:2-dehydropantoate 2-reductase|nr:putative 2-dehydropantoate 2-reductase [Lentisphaerota bacterium]MBT4819172.1 putative 2-dehydropantoate 2-reductase [Lentisphaerota bacterium]MBT5604324.1 putative 2-dehydropantoate 2-reductase [Lentisphaerota bacterium]MBT7060265.1 putative 2-dehydropantoate 2-reductase [Lentisphaerota bacterium]MBT7847568.1 putative 2-dehydropantoate 2-reductase [Lentisphaerota bacterium]
MSGLSYAIVGAGALGGLYGARLHASGEDVHFLLNSDYEHVRSNGLLVESIWGDLNLSEVNAYASSSEMPACDVVCVCLKTTHNGLLSDLLPPLLRGGTVVLLMQNGLGGEDEVASAFPGVDVAGGLCYLCSNKVGPGHVRHLDYGRVTLAPFAAACGERLGAIAETFCRAGIPCTTDEDLLLARWKKLFWNVPFNGLTVALGTETDQIMGCVETRRLAAALMHDLRCGAEACGHKIEEAYISEMLDFTLRMKPYSPSMKLDYLAKRPLELEYIYRRPIAAAQSAGQSMPCVETLASLLSFLDERNRA